MCSKKNSYYSQSSEDYEMDLDYVMDNLAQVVSTKSNSFLTHLIHPFTSYQFLSPFSKFDCSNAHFKHHALLL